MATLPEHIFLTGNPGVGKSTCVIKVVESLQKGFPASSLKVTGFFTEERREKEERVGFDIVYWNEQSTLNRIPLARVGSRKPKIGKYSVDVHNVKTFAVESLRPPDSGSELTLGVIDEVGKMELLCRDFYPAVTSLLDCVKPPSAVIGTVPLPRRPIREVDAIKFRSDVIVLMVTRSNRDQLAVDIAQALSNKMNGSNTKSLRETLNAYTTASSPPQSGNPNRAKKQNKNQQQQQRHADGEMNRSNDAQPVQRPNLKPCGPLVSNEVGPIVLLMGISASPLPDQRGMEYSERSMWKILSIIVGQPKHTDVLSYQRVKAATVARGIAIWDVLSNVHDKGTKKGKGTKDERPNDLVSLVELYPSLSAFCFIGAHARNTFGRHFGVEKDAEETLMAKRPIKLLVLPSSSGSNKMKDADKAKLWAGAFEQFK